MKPITKKLTRQELLTIILGATRLIQEMSENMVKVDPGLRPKTKKERKTGKASEGC